MYEMFSAQSQEESSRSYWLLNSSNSERIAGIITDIGVPLNEKIGLHDSYGFRLVGYLKKDKVISNG